MTVDTPQAHESIGAVILAAGLSSRMGQPKQLLPWDGTVMIRHVVNTLVSGGADVGNVVVVVGHQQEAVREALHGLPVQIAFNDQYADGSMLRSLQVGLATLNARTPDPWAALIALSDQPQIQAQVTRQVIERWHTNYASIVAPSFSHKRGHPMLFSRAIWTEILAAPPVGSPRELLLGFGGRIDYLEVTDDEILRDIDTPEDYQQELQRRV
jgi:molybdenum cofactor cytidylyltransferase